MYARVTEALDVTGLTSLYLNQFKLRKLNDASVIVCLRYASLRSALEKSIPVESHRQQFVEAFTNPPKKGVVIEEKEKKNGANDVNTDGDTEVSSTLTLRQNQSSDVVEPTELATDTAINNEISTQITSEIEVHSSDTTPPDEATQLNNTSVEELEEKEINPLNHHTTESDSEENFEIIDSSTIPNQTISTENVETDIVPVIESIPPHQPNVTATEGEVQQPQLIQNETPPDESNIDPESEVTVKDIDDSSNSLVINDNNGDYKNNKGKDFLIHAPLEEIMEKDSANQLQNDCAAEDKVKDQYELSGQRNVGAVSENQIRLFHALVFLIIVLSINYLLSFFVSHS